VLLLAVLAFIASGVRALGASSRTHPWTQPGFNDIFDHAKLDLTDAQAAHAAAYLKAAGQNLRIVQVKGGYLNAAVFWFRLALALLAVLAAMFVAYTAWGQPSSTHPAKPASPSPAKHKHP
jgi:cytochrome oxidase assembly protein ShyY1